MSELQLYTAGKFAKKAGVTLKTIHYYDRQNILKPCSYNEAGYRLYNEEDFAKLQKILTLKYLGFSLEEIKEMIKSRTSEDNLAASLKLQEKIINEKINHLNLVKKAINEAQRMIEGHHTLNWNQYISIIHIINLEKTLLNQYKNSSNLSARINVHDRFSTNKQGWHNWLFEKLDIKPDLKILELGCGNATLWVRNLEKLPQNTDVTLTDLYDGMLEDAKANLGENAPSFKYQKADAQHIPFDDNSFHIVIANHMLYHVPERNLALKEIYRVLKPGGILYASTIGKAHLSELNRILYEFDPNLYMSEFDYSEAFGLETGESQLCEFFKNVVKMRYEDSLMITEPKPLMDYIYSASGNAKDILKKDKKDSFIKFLSEKLKKEGKIYITKDSGVFKAIK